MIVDITCMLLACMASSILDLAFYTFDLLLGDMSMGYHGTWQVGYLVYFLVRTLGLYCLFYHSLSLYIIHSVLHVVAPSLIQDVAELYAKTTSSIKALEPFRVRSFLVKLMSAMEKQNLP